MLTLQDLVQLSMVCRRANQIAHQSRHYLGQDQPKELEDHTDGLDLLRSCVLNWPFVALKFVAKLSEGQTLPSFDVLRVLGKVVDLELKFAVPVAIVDFGFLDANKIQDLSLSGNILSFEACVSLRLFLGRSSNIKSLYMWNNELSEHSSVVEFTSGLQQNRSLAVLSITACYFQSSGAKMIFDALATSPSITSICLCENRVGDRDDFEYLTRALTTSKTLLALGFCRNDAGPRVAESICRALSTGSTVTSVSLNGNLFEDEAAKYFGQMLKANNTLLNLQIKKNPTITAVGLGHLATGLQTNTTLISFGYPVEEYFPEIDEIANCIDRNRATSPLLAGRR
eukprot:c12182_g1_i1.p1 GENE.c12182_g1_i1~~c12182_g1_i1.p1  ORF type:complete len:341 (-),score=46.91 c12182_g1_i1:371-1393(-)